MRRRAGTHQGRDDRLQRDGPRISSAPRRKSGALRSIRGTALRKPEASSRRVLLVLAVLYQIVDHGGIRQRRGVAETSRLVLGDLAQDAAHDLAGTGFG